GVRGRLLPPVRVGGGPTPRPLPPQASTKPQTSTRYLAVRGGLMPVYVLPLCEPWPVSCKGRSSDDPEMATGDDGHHASARVVRLPGQAGDTVVSRGLAT